MTHKMNELPFTSLSLFIFIHNIMIMNGELRAHFSGQKTKREQKKKKKKNYCRFEITQFEFHIDFANHFRLLHRSSCGRARASHSPFPHLVLEFFDRNNNLFRYYVLLAHHISINVYTYSISMVHWVRRRCPCAPAKWWRKCKLIFYFGLTALSAIVSVCVDGSRLIDLYLDISGKRSITLCYGEQL